ncbi:glycosyltransferase [Gandjariella thermophila]|uniref:glycosyltransferase n=1 Tax=Gandjariella thermophila TaxID=1931992 RepID=UPI0010FA27C3|nr:glycosyltransferase [Gandjariella thermophila]
MTALAIVLATLGAICYGVAAWLQHAAVRTETPGGVRLGGLLRLARAPRWLAGLVLIGVGAALHATALGLASIVVVQPIGVLAIAVTAVLAARSTGARPGTTTTLAVLACIAGVGVFVALAVPGGTAAVPPAAETRAALLVLCLIAVLGTVGKLARGRRRCLAYAAGAGVGYGLVSVLVHTTARQAETAGLGGVPVLPAAGIAAALLVGGVFVQHAYASGPPHLVVACLTVVDPVLGVGIGVVLLREHGAAGPWAVAGQLGAAALALAGVAVLARVHHAGGLARAHPRHATHQLAKERSVSPHPFAETGPLRIVIGADTFPPDINGAARFAERLARGLARRGHEVHVLCPATEAGPGSEIIGSGAGEVTVHRVVSHRTPFHPEFRICMPWRAFRAAGALLADLDPDVVHAQAHFLVGRALIRTAGRRGIPVVATNHFMPENLFGHAKVPPLLRSAAARWAWRDLGRVYRDAQAVTAPTPRAVRLLRDNGLAADAVAISCGIDLDQFRAPQSTPPAERDGRTVLFVGRLDEEKRVDELLRATALLAEDVRPRLDIVGDGSCRTAWQAMADGLGLRDWVRFRGFVDDDELIAAYAGCDAFCMPGIAELQSLATMEAMAAGKPVIAADAMALPHLVRPGQNGWLYPPGDVAALADRLRRLLTEPGALTRMGAASRRIIAEHAIDHTLDRFETVYRRVLGHPEPAVVVGAAVPSGVPARYPDPNGHNLEILTRPYGSGQ